MANNRRDVELAIAVTTDMQKAHVDLRNLQKDLDDVSKTSAEWGREAGQAADMASGLAGVAGQASRAQLQNAKAAKAAGVSTKQYSAALRQLPAQFTDIAVSLQAGQAPLTVLLQQGGQLKDVFGGVGPALRATGQYVIGLINPLTVSAAAVAALALAYKQGSDEETAYTKALIRTGNVAGTTADALADMAANIDDVSGTQRQAAAAVAEIAGTGKFAADQIERIGTVAVLMENNVGQAVSETVTEFAKLSGAPAKAAAELNDKYHFLTQSVYEQIAALERQGDTTGAAEVAIRAYADTMERRAVAVEANLGSIERGWKAVKSAAAETWDAMLGVGRSDSLAQRLKEAREQLAELEASPGNYDFYGRKKSDKVAVAQRNVAQLEAQKAEQDAAAKREGERQRAQDAAIAAQRENDRIHEQSLTRIEQKEKAIAEYRANVEKIRAVNPKSDRISEDRVAKGIAAIEEKFKEPAPKKDPRESTYAALNKQITERMALLQAATDSETKLTDAQRFAEKIQATLADGTTKLTAAQKDALQVRLQALAEADKANQSAQDAKLLADVQTQYLRALGNNQAVAQAEIEKRYGDLLTRLKARGDQAGIDLINNLINVEQAGVQLQQMQREIDRVLSEQSRGEQSVQTQLQAGLMTEVDARERIVDLSQQTADKLTALRPQLQELSKMPGDVGQSASAALVALDQQAEQLRTTTGLLAETLRVSFQEGLAGALQTLATSTGNLREAMQGLLDTVLNALSQLAAQELAQQLTSSVAGLFGGGNESPGADAATSAAGATATATAITTASTAGATAMGTGIATGGTAAGTAMATSITTAGSIAAQAMATAIITASAGGDTADAAASAAAVLVASGGHVTGPGSGTSDSIPAWLSNNEYVTRAAVVTQRGALPFLRDFNSRGMAALDEWAMRRVRHATGGLAGVPAPSMPAPLRLAGSMSLEDGGKGSSTTLKNAQNFYLVDDPQRIVDAAFNSRAGEQALVVAISRDPGKFRSILNIN